MAGEETFGTVYCNVAFEHLSVVLHVTQCSKLFASQNDLKNKIDEASAEVVFRILILQKLHCTVTVPVKTIGGQL